MKLFKIILVGSFLVFLSSCDKGKVCECTSKYSDGSPDETKIHETLDKTSDPDCSSHEGTVTENGVDITTTCIAVDA